MKTKNLPIKEENPVYFRIGYYEALESKKDILASEMAFLNLIKIARRYNLLKEEELEIKNKMYKAIKELDLLTRKTKASFPFLKLPEKQKETVNKEVIVIKPARKDYDENLEAELRKIQEKLKSMSGY
jgi:hypothetical protein